MECTDKSTELRRSPTQISSFYNGGVIIYVHRVFTYKIGSSQFCCAYDCLISANIFRGWANADKKNILSHLLPNTKKST